jgi:ubiquinone/menaquinone biosynthesis C-methylase UbiE
MTERLFQAAGLAPGMRVLDVGSGAGDVAFLAAELVGPDGVVVGVDVDGAALATARARAELLGLRNVTFIEGDVGTAALDDAFDAAVGLFGMLGVVTGRRPEGEPPVGLGPVEGWILGQAGELPEPLPS